MAEYGLTVRNSSNFVQIDSLYKNLGLIAKGSTTAPDYAGGANGGYYQGYVTVTGTNPVIALYSTDYCKPRLVTKSGSTHTFYIWCRVQNQPFDYYVFDNSANATISGNYGLQVRDAGGALVFDSRLPYMRVLDVRNYFYDGTGGVPSDSASYSVAKIAVVHSQFIMDDIIVPQNVGPNPDYIEFDFQTVVSTSSNVFTLGWDTVSITQYPNGSTIPIVINNQCRYGSYMILDVSNY